MNIHYTLSDLEEIYESQIKKSWYQITIDHPKRIGSVVYPNMSLGFISSKFDYPAKVFKDLVNADKDYDFSLTFSSSYYSILEKASWKPKEKEMDPPKEKEMDPPPRYTEKRSFWSSWSFWSSK